LISYCQQDTSVIFLNGVEIYETKDLHNIGVKITKIDSLLITQKSSVTLSELLLENSQLFVKSTGKGSFSTASFRGTTASHTKVSWNNVELNSPILGSADLSLIPISLLDKIEIIPGAGALTENTQTLGGLIKLNSLADWREGCRFVFSSSVGSFYSFDDFFNLKLGNSKFQSSTSLFYDYSKNNFPFFNSTIINGSKEYRQNADYQKYGFNQEFYFRIKALGLLSVKFWFQNLDRGIPGLTTNESGPNNNINRDNSNNAIYSAEYVYASENYSFRLNNGGNFLDSRYLSDNFINGKGYYKTIDSKGTSFSLFNSALINYKLKNYVELTTTLFYDFFKINSMENVKNQGYDTIRNEGGITFSAFSSFIRNFKFGFLLKQSFYDKNTAPFVSSAFLEYQFNKFLFAKSSISKNYHIPSINDLYYKPGGNINLLPEKGFSVDGGLESKFSKNQFKFFSDLNINYGKINDWIMWKPTAMGFWSPINIEKVVTYGLDYNLKLNMIFSKVNFSIFSNYAFTISENRATPLTANDNSFGKQIPYIPKHSANLFCKITFYDFWFSYQWIFYSKRLTTIASDMDYLTIINSYFMNNLSVGKSFYTHNFQFVISLDINNLFNENYYSVIWQPMPGINFSFHLTIKYK
jgi:iron complex outermembrane receptor protein